jgi:P27 family predicted phage terminase small subunit
MARLPNQNLTPGRPAKPPGLSKKASVEWDRIVEELTNANVQLSVVHSRLIEQAATIAVDLQDAAEVVEHEGAYVTNEKTGVVQLHPAARRVDSLRLSLVKVLSLLGMRSASPGGEKPQSLSALLD